MDHASFQARRAGYRVRFHWLQRMLKRPPGPVREFMAGKHYRQRIADVDKAEEQDKGRQAIWSVRKRLLRWNRTPGSPDPVPLDVQRAIADHYRGEIDRLGALIGRDLSHWLQPRERGQAAS